MGQIAQAAQNRQMVQATPAQNMKALLAKSWPRIAAVIGNNLSPERLYQMYVSTINREPALAECTVESVLSCFMKCAALGLEPSNVNNLGMAYVVPFGNKNMRTGQREATFILGYRGMIELARRSGQIKDISARAVHEGDQFEYAYGLEEKLVHVPCAKPGKLTHVYMVAHFKDGGHYMQVLTLDEINQAMRRSASGNRGPWKTDFEAMAKKTVIRRAFPFLPVSVEAQTAAVSDERTPDYGDVFRPVIPDQPDVIDTEAAEESPAEGTQSAPAADSDETTLEEDRINAKIFDLMNGFKTLGVADEAEACKTVSKIINREVTSFREMSEAELDKVLDDLSHGTKKKDGE